MSVLDRRELEASPLADLHALASELGLEGFRRLRREELIDAILEAQGGGEEGEQEPPEEVLAEARQVAQDLREVAEAAEAAAEDQPAVDEEEWPDEVPAGESLVVGETEEEAGVEEAGVEEGEVEGAEVEGAEVEGAEVAEPEHELREGVLDVLPNGSGFIRRENFAHSRDDVYVSPAQIRRCELRPGDVVAGPVREPRRNERHPSLVRVESVNGEPAEPPAERPRFDELTPTFASERLAAPEAIADLPIGKGSRVAIGGPPGAGATSLLRQIVKALREQHADVEVAVALVGVRPEEVPEWRSVGVQVVGGGADRSPDEQAQAIELAIERGKRTAERGGHAAVVVDSLDALSPGVARRVFAAARRTEEAGSLTVIAATGGAAEPQRVATTRIVLEPPAAGQGPRPSGDLSATLHADRLG